MLTFLIIYSVILTIVVFLLIYGVWNILQKNDTLEDVINRTYSRVSLTIKLMRMFDEKQMFESDDEVGETFKQLKDCTEELYTYVTELRDGAIETDQE